MYDEDRIIKALESATKKSYTNDLSVDNNSQNISNQTSVFRDFKIVKPHGKVVFIDGGSSPILTNSEFLAGFIRLASCEFIMDKCSNRHIVESYIILTKSEKKRNCYICEMLQENSKNAIVIPTLEIVGDSLGNSSNDEASNLKQSLILSAANTARRIAELNFAIKKSSELVEGDMIVIDGSLDYISLEEKPFLDKLINNSLNKKILLCGLSKSSTRFIVAGKKMIQGVSSMSIEHLGIGFYETAKISPINPDLNTVLARLHPTAKQEFRIDSLKAQTEGSNNQLYSILAYFSNDALFPGYPYGLIAADKFARVSNQESEYLRIKLTSRLESEKPELLSGFTAKTAHQILDKASF